MVNPGDFINVIRSGAPWFAAAVIVADARTEFDQFASLLEAAIAEAERAQALDSPERRRAFDMSRALRDIAAANAGRMGRIERILLKRHRRAR